MIFARPFLVLSLAFAVSLLTSPAEAARKKGKKKGGEHAHSGMVESVNHKTGAFTIKTSHHRAKKSAAGKKMGAGKGKGKGKGKSIARRAKGKGAGQGNQKKGGGNMTFHVHRGTKFQGGSFKTLHKGEHVTVMAQGQRADDVKIGGGGGKAKPKRKKKV